VGSAGTDRGWGGEGVRTDPQHNRGVEGVIAVGGGGGSGGMRAGALCRGRGGSGAELPDAKVREWWTQGMTRAWGAMCRSELCDAKDAQRAQMDDVTCRISVDAAGPPIGADGGAGSGAGGRHTATTYPAMPPATRGALTVFNAAGAA